MDEESKKEESELNEIQKHLESLGFDTTQNEIDAFKISFSVAASGIVDVSLDWPEESSEKNAEMTATLLFSLDSGLLKNLMLESIMNTIEQYPESKGDIQKVVEKWAELENSTHTNPCIKPSDTLNNS